MKEMQGTALFRALLRSAAAVERKAAPSQLRAVEVVRQSARANQRYTVAKGQRLAAGWRVKAEADGREALDALKQLRALDRSTVRAVLGVE